MFACLHLNRTCSLYVDMQCAMGNVVYGSFIIKIIKQFHFSQATFGLWALRLIHVLKKNTKVGGSKV